MTTARPDDDRLDEMIMPPIGITSEDWSPGLESSIKPIRLAAGYAALAHLPRIGYGSPERKEVMCSDRQYA